MEEVTKPQCGCRVSGYHDDSACLYPALLAKRDEAVRKIEARLESLLRVAATDASKFLSALADEDRFALAAIRKE